MTTRSSTRFPTQEDEAAWRQAGSPPISTDSPPDLRFAAGDLGFFGFTEVPNEEGALLAAIQASPGLGEPARALDLLDAVADLLRRPYAPPEYRATLFRVVADIEGVEASSDGVEVLVSLAAERQRLELVFDAETSELLVERTIEIAPDGSEQLFQEIRYLESGIVASVEDRP